jgi:hypothetical protein
LAEGEIGSLNRDKSWWRNFKSVRGHTESKWPIYWLLGLPFHSADPAKTKQMKAEGIGPTRLLQKIGRASVYRALGESLLPDHCQSLS